MRLSNNLVITLHRTVRVADGRVTSNLPPSLGHVALHKVSDYRKSCPKEWDDGACFGALHETEAMWISFQPSKPCAVLVGAGGVNALTGQKLGTKLEKDNYLVCPPQPWIDGWKDVGGTVYQFVATAHKKGKGITVGEQILGKESQTGAIGIAVFDAIQGKIKAPESFYPTVSETGFQPQSFTSSGIHLNSCLPTVKTLSASSSISAQTSKGIHGSTSGILRSAPPLVSEMGLGKGGKIVQKIYPDPHGLDVWQEKPSAVFAFYLVDAETAQKITGEKVAKPVESKTYTGPWFSQKDQSAGDVAGAAIFSGLKSAAFTGDVSNVEKEAEGEGSGKEKKGEPVSSAAQK